jgi:hypothetical protein
MTPGAAAMTTGAAAESVPAVRGRRERRSVRTGVS